MNSQKNNTPPSFWSGFWMKFFIAVSIGAFILVTYALFKETYKKYQIQKEVEELRQEAEQLEKNNQKLRGLVEYFKTENYSEKGAREKLNLKKEGEQVVVLRSPENYAPEKGVAESEEEPEEIALPNPLKWWDYFLK